MTTSAGALDQSTWRAPRPEYQGLFQEPVYADGGPYDSDTEEDPDGPGIITA